MANEIYMRKADSHARVKAGMLLPVDTQYFLESYESCLQFTEWLEKELHELADVSLCGVSFPTHADPL